MRRILDVGCGTGLLCQYIQQQIDSASSPPAQVVGVDYSAEMVNIARMCYPDATFVQTDFLAYRPAAEGEGEGGEGEGLLFDSIVFNESLHNFLDVRAALAHARQLLRPGGGGGIVVSNPKGYHGIVSQRSINKWLAPSLLPDDREVLDLAKELEMKVLLLPDVKSSHYLAVLQS